MKKKPSSILFYESKKRFQLYKLLVLVLLSFQCNTPLPAQEENPFQLIQTIEKDIVFFETDKLGQVYLYSNDEKLYKYDSNGQFLFEYTNFSLGELKAIDVTDPFNVLLYFADFGEVVTLNRTLNESSAFNLFDLGYQDVAVVGMSNDNNIWLYDPNRYKLKKINRKGDLIGESIPMINQFDNLEPDYLVERGNKVYVNEPTEGVLLFDAFGQYMKSFSSLKGLERFQVIDDRILYQKELRFWSYDLLTAKTKEIVLPDLLNKDSVVNLQTKRLYLLKEGRLKIYKF